MQSFNQMMDFYAQHHRLRMTKITHFIGIPMVIFSIQIFLSLFHFFTIPLAWIMLALVMIYYLILTIPLAIMAGFFLFVLTYIAYHLSMTQTHGNLLILGGSFFIGGWLFQFIGHYVEGKPPAFFKNSLQVFIAPLFLCVELSSLFRRKKTSAF